ATAKLPRHQPGLAPDSTRNRAQPSALQLQLDFPEAVRRQRNLRNSRTRDFRSSASGMEISAGIRENNSTHSESQRYGASAVLPGAISYLRAGAADFVFARAVSKRKIVSPSFIKSSRSRAIVSK